MKKKPTTTDPVEETDSPAVPEVAETAAPVEAGPRLITPQMACAALSRTQAPEQPTD